MLSVLHLQTLPTEQQLDGSEAVETSGGDDNCGATNTCQTCSNCCNTQEDFV